MWVLTTLVAASLVACGGGSDAPVASCEPFTDSFNKPVTCEEMRQLSGADKSFVDGGDASSGAGDAGADGTGADGAPIANMDLEFVDINGQKVTTKTDANGYYRISLRGMKAPLVATVKRDGKPWKSMLVQDIVRAPNNRKFYTINLTGLTDVVASEVAKKAGFSGADALTPAVVKAQEKIVPEVVIGLNNQLQNTLKSAGLDPATFNPLTSAFFANKEGYDKVLEETPITRTQNGETIFVNTKFAFSPEDSRLYRVYLTDGTSYSQTRKVVATIGNEIERLEYTDLRTNAKSYDIYDQNTRRIESISSSGVSCKFTPPEISFFSIEAANISVGQSLSTPASNRNCSDGSSTPGSASSLILDGYEKITTAAGTFNTRVWKSENTSFRTIFYLDVVMNRIVISKSINLSTNVTSTLQELVSFSIKNYPKSSLAPTSPPTSGNILSANQLRGDLESTCERTGVGRSEKTIATFTPNADGTVNLAARNFEYSASEVCTGANTVETENGVIRLTGSKQTTDGLTVQKIEISLTSPIATTARQILYPVGTNGIRVGNGDGSRDADGYPNTLETEVDRFL